MRIYINHENEMFSLSKKMISEINSSIVIYLNGKIGSGKTTFAKGIIKSLGYKSVVNSPTFSISKEYKNNIRRSVYHFDFYRIKSRFNINKVGINCNSNDSSIYLIEWAEKAKNFAPKSDLLINFFQICKKRKLFLYANTKKGKKVIFNLS